jgi:hypothetical protein
MTETLRTLSIQSSFHYRAGKLYRLSNYIENYAEDCMPHMKSIKEEYINLKQKLNEYWKAHQTEIDALYKKIVTKRSPFSPIIPFYESIRSV